MEKRSGRARAGHRLGICKLITQGDKQWEGPRSQFALFPLLGVRPRGMGVVAFLLFATAAALLFPASLAPWSLLPGSPEVADQARSANYHWLIYREGLAGAASSDLLLYPVRVNWLTKLGFPVDAIFSYPFTLLLGWPTGYTLFTLAALWLAGLSMGWLAGRWWRSSAAALIAGVVLQCSCLICWELNGGRVAQVFGLIFIPLALGYFCLAVSGQRMRYALLAGAACGAAMLSYWFFGFFLAVALAIILLTAIIEGRFVFMPCLVFALGVLFVAGVPAWYALEYLDKVPGIHLGAWNTFSHLGLEMPLAKWISRENPLLQSQDPMGVQKVHVAVSILLVLGVIGVRARRWVAPVFWAAFGLVLALGPWVPLPGGTYLPGPYLALLNVPILGRLWWPYQMLFLVTPAVALLAGGGGARMERFLARGRSMQAPEQEGTPPLWVPRWSSQLTPLVGPLAAGAVLVEAFLSVPALPLAAASSRPSSKASFLARSEEPLFLLPFRKGSKQLDASRLADQIHHGRSLVNGGAFPLDTVAPVEYRLSPIWPVVDFLARCELDGTVTYNGPEVALRRLEEVGLTQITLDLAALEGIPDETKESYFACIESILGTKHTDEAGFRLYPVSGKLPVDELNGEAAAR